ncbi:MAG: DNA polymerase III subunit beta [Candidatus Aminicenantes bacterium RBG_19FT_COMBO_58_17]|nr:MAG: DNA polymerase III subunit beta [Candidatus Aminicenantes bacterium RBG_19FT_COMBO_58_17]HCS47888.1 DNA polymerase III subunit beta [Candidatus Aminicenantes bacterium]
MKFSVVKEAILAELQLLQGIVEKRNTMPILANILITAGEDKVEMTGTDLEVGLRTHFPVKTEEPGSITISGKKIFEIVKSLPDERMITFEENDDLMMEISSGKSEFKVLCLPKEDYPLVPEAKFERRIALPLSRFQEMIDRVYFAIAQEQRYYLNGALLILKKEAVELVSTDGHRLSYTSTFVDGLDPGEEVRVIVAKKTLGELRKITNDAVEFDHDENNLFFRVGNRMLISRIIESKFPNFEAVIPKENPHLLRVAKEEFTQAIRRVSLLSSERSRGVKFSIGKGSLKLFSSNPEIGEARDDLDVDYKGTELEVGFNSQYLLDFLLSIRSERIRLELKDENSAAIMKPDLDEDIKYTYVLMPMKI